MVSLLSDPEKVRELLDTEHELNAMVIGRLFSDDPDMKVYVDYEADPHGVMVLQKGSPNHCAIYADNEGSFRHLVRTLNSGEEYQFSGMRDIFLPYLEKEFEITDINPCWFFVLGKEGVKGEVRHEVTSLVEDDIETVAHNWEFFDGAYDHVRDRVINGMSAAIREDGKLIGWDATHFETDKVVMLGFLFVFDEHRKGGYATSMCVVLTNRILETGKKPVFYVVKDNEPSVKFSQKIGYEIVDSHSWVTGVKK
jgi:RimJ/RimL family protein N-acetyltransferase